MYKADALEVLHEHLEELEPLIVSAFNNAKKKGKRSEDLENKFKEDLSKLFGLTVQCAADAFLSTRKSKKVGVKATLKHVERACAAMKREVVFRENRRQHNGSPKEKTPKQRRSQRRR